MSRSILYIGEDGSGTNCVHRANALRRLGHHVLHIGTSRFVNNHNIVVRKLHFLSGHEFEQRLIRRNLDKVLKSLSSDFDVVWVDSGWWCGPSVLDMLRPFGGRILLWNNDDPTGGAQPWHWRSLRSALPGFDYCVAVRPETAAEMRQLGARQVGLHRMGYDEVAHAPEQAESVPSDSFRSQVAFIGTRMEDRHQFLIDLISRDVPVSIWGDRWRNSRGWRILRNCWRGPAIGGAEYVAAIQRAHVCLGLLSKGNRDLYTTRTSEVPFAGGVLCARRTSEHLKMYDENEEAVFWDDADECATQCLRLIQSPGLREKLRCGGMRRVRQAGVGNEEVCAEVLTAALQK